MHLKVTAGQSGLRTLVIIMTYIYHALINALSAHMIHINLNMIFYAHVEHRPTKTIYIKCYTEKANRPTKTIYIKCYTEKANGHMRYTHTHTHCHVKNMIEPDSTIRKCGGKTNKKKH